MARRESKWTSIYWDVEKAGEGLKPYVRFTPDFMDMEHLGFPHGISLGGQFFKDKDAAIQFADRIDAFFDAMVVDLKEDEAENAGNSEISKVLAYMNDEYPEQ